MKDMSNAWVSPSEIEFGVALFTESPWNMIDYEKSCMELLNNDEITYFLNYSAAKEFVTAMLAENNKYVYATIDLLLFDTNGECIDAHVVYEAGVEKYVEPDNTKLN